MAVRVQLLAHKQELQSSLPLSISVTIYGRNHPSPALIGVFGKSGHKDLKTFVLNSEMISYQEIC
jgi:hypothetical protein